MVYPGIMKNIIGIVSVAIIVACATAYGYRKESFGKSCKRRPKRLDVLYGYKVALPAY